jgi:integrase/recombinase XerD
MKSLRAAVEDYLALRRGLGFKLRLAGPALLDFAAFRVLPASVHDG